MKLLVLFAMLVSACLAAPQEKNQQMTDTMKAMQPGEHHKQLDGLAGSWDVMVKFKYGPGPERQSHATSEALWILGGRFIQQVYKNESGLEVRQFLGYDNQKKKFFEIKLDNMDTGVLRTEGTISEDGKVITNIGERTDPMTGQTTRLRTVTTIIDRDHYTLEWYQSAGGEKEDKVVTMLHTRKK
ncbi:MAG TPA: DUF1579 family protein [Blastocatellia bacterium]|nr:DUF1579 family protein [Blastocatellia bacterium]